MMSRTCTDSVCVRIETVRASVFIIVIIVIIMIAFVSRRRVLRRPGKISRVDNIVRRREEIDLTHLFTFDNR